MAYTSDRNYQIVIEILKFHKIKKVIASPGATNVSFVASIQQDPYFEIYSSVDERSAAYMACGMAAESGEPIVLTCTGATASRNYLPGLTEAYYRKLPVIAVTSTRPISFIGHNYPQVIDRTNVINDVSICSVQIPMIKDDIDEWNCTIKVNEAILRACSADPGPVHLNVETNGARFNVEAISPVNVIRRFYYFDQFPKIDDKKKIAIFVGAHQIWTEHLMSEVDKFCENYNAVVICDNTSNYKGKYQVLGALVTHQKDYYAKCRDIDIVIHIGAVSGAYIEINPKEVWRVSPDGNLCDTFKALSCVFEMEEVVFFENYNKQKKGTKNTTFYDEWCIENSKLLNKIPELPFSNLWCAHQIANKLPENAVVHLAILNSLRSWNYFKISNSVAAYSNTGGFGIDGCLSTVLGAALMSKSKLFFCVIGDLAFFYDMNALGNRHFPPNVRILLINNGRGQEFRNPNHIGSQFGEDTDIYIAAAGHYGAQSPVLVKSYAESLGFDYCSATDKNSFMSVLPKFTSKNINRTPMILEVFTSTDDESNALNIMRHLESSTANNAKAAVKELLGQKGVKAIKRMLKGD